jgi:hypothetical protein
VLAETSVFFREAVDLTRNPGLQRHILSNFGGNFRGVFGSREMSWYIVLQHCIYLFFSN